MRTLLTFLIVFVTFTVFAQTKPSIRFEDKVRIREAFIIEKKYGESLWKDYTKAPFSIILVYKGNEFLINHPNPSSDFISLGFDSFLNSKVYYRKRVFNKYFLATFPAVNGVSCIVVGTSKNTKKTTADWVITILHERFHQYQQNSKNFYQDAMALGISNGDNTGMWQLNYPFPYQDSEINLKYNNYTASLKRAVEMIDTNTFAEAFAMLLKSKNEFKRALKPTDYKYFSFQLYQEGIARYTEFLFLEALENYQPSKEITKINDFVGFNVFKKEFYKKHMNNITSLQLNTHKRVCFYDLGLAEGILLNKLNPKWRDQYLLDKFDVTNFYLKKN